MSTAGLHVVGSAHEARFGEDFDVVLADLIAACHDPVVAGHQLDELMLLTVLAQFAAAGRWDAAVTGPSGQNGDVVPSDHNPMVWLHRYALHYQPGLVVDIVTFEGYTLQPYQTVVRTAAVTTSL